MASRRIEVEIIGDTKQLERALGRAAGSSQTNFQKIQKAAKYAGLAIAGALGVTAKIGFDELSQQLKVGAQTSAVLESTGGAANVTKGHVEELAQALLKKSGVDDEAIQSGENLLLTFRNIQNQVGKGNDIFDQATKATLDLSVAMGKDMKSSSILVGKALNDPIKGLTALGRAGVQFTDAQKKQIKAMVESGNVAGAQKIILRELNKEFGGSAEAAGKTLPGQLNIAKESLTNLSAEIVKALLPALTNVAGKLTSGAKFLSEHTTATKVAVAALAGLGAVLLTVSAATKIYAAGQAIVKAATAAWTAGQWLLNAALTANPIGLVIVAIAALAIALVIAWKKSATFRAIVTGAFGAVRSAAGAVANFITKTIPAAFGSVVSAAGRLKSGIVEKFNAVVSFIRGMPGRIAKAASGMFDGIKTAFRGAINWIINAWNGLSFTLPGVDTHIPGVGKVGGFTIGTPDIPNVAKGGIVMPRRGGTVLRAGEAGQREAIVPLPRGGGLLEPVFNIDVLISPDVVGKIADVRISRANRRSKQNLLARKTWEPS